MWNAQVEKMPFFSFPLSSIVFSVMPRDNSERYLPKAGRGARVIVTMSFEKSVRLFE
jgi:hypothetical protein